MPSVSVVIPAYNEEAAIQGVVRAIRAVLAAREIEHEVVVVVDGATDQTEQLATGVADQVVVHPTNLGYGRSLKTGILAAHHDLVAIIDADGTYPVERLPDLIDAAERFDMVVGARTGAHYRGSLLKAVCRWAFRQLSEWSVGQTIPDINSGMRAFRRSQMLLFFPVISAGFSFTTTSTLAYMHHDLYVHYIPIVYHKREGRSKVRHVRDSLRALQIIVEAILRYNPVKIFLPLAFPFLVASLFLVLYAVLAQSATVLIAGIVAAAGGVLTLALGFLAVSVMPQRRVVNSRITTLSHHRATVDQTVDAGL